MLNKYGLSESESQQIKDVFEKYPDVRTVYIYGSRAKNTFTAKSDIDLAVEFKPNATTNIGTIKSDLEDLPIIFEFDLTDQADITPSKFQDAYNQTKQVFHKIGWTETTLGEIVETIIDNRGKNPSYYCNEGIPVIDNVLIKDERKINLDETRRFIDENLYANFIRKHCKEDDIIITLVGNGYGNIALFPNKKSVIIQNTIGLRTNNKCISKYLFYYLLCNKKPIKDLNIGAAQPSIKVGHLLEINLHLPPLDEQKSIAEILSAFDDKIELLRDQNKTLESLGQTIFKEWFGKYSPDRPDELPEGWRVGKLGDICKLQSGYAFKGTDFVENSNIQALKIKDLKGNGIVDITNLAYIKNSLIESKRVQHFKLNTGDIVVAMSGNTTGKIGIIPKSSNNIFLNQRVGKFFLVDEDFKSLLYFFLMSGNYEKVILNMGYGSAQPNINPTQIENIKFIQPSNIVFKKFTELSNTIYLKTLKNLHQIELLNNQKNQLLLKLMQFK